MAIVSLYLTKLFSSHSCQMHCKRAQLPHSYQVSALIFTKGYFSVCPLNYFANGSLQIFLQEISSSATGV